MLEYANGTRFEGEFREDKANGHGVMTYSNNELYEGSWFNG